MGSGHLGARPEGGHLGLIALLLGLAAAAWAITGERVLEPPAQPELGGGTVALYVAAWVAMLAAMMFPSTAPMVRTFALVHRRRVALGHARGSAAVAGFVGGYIAAWTLFGLAAYAVVAVVDSLAADVLAWERAGRWVTAVVIAAAAAYQLTPAKGRCLTNCRGPLDFLMARWRDGFGGAVRLGAEHGAWCVGCCWALMATLFALGTMSIGWMVVVAAIIASEKLLPWQPLPSRVTAALLLVLAAAVAVAPEAVPGLGMHDAGG